MRDPTAVTVEIDIAGHDYTIKQSPGLLQSNIQSGTTGAAVWRVSVAFAEWLVSRNNPLFAHGVLKSTTSTVIELGSGE